MRSPASAGDPVHSDPAFYLLYRDALASGASVTLEGLTLQGYQFLETVNNSPKGSALFTNANQPVQSTHLLCGALSFQVTVHLP